MPLANPSCFSKTTCLAFVQGSTHESLSRTLQYVNIAWRANVGSGKKYKSLKNRVAIEKEKQKKFVFCLRKIHKCGLSRCVSKFCPATKHGIFRNSKAWYWAGTPWQAYNGGFSLDPPITESPNDITLVKVLQFSTKRLNLMLGLSKRSLWLDWKTFHHIELVYGCDRWWWCGG